MRNKIFLLFASLMLLLMSMEAWSFNYQPSDIGKLMGSDGNVYATATDMPSGVTVSGMIAYFNANEKWGLVIGPSDLNHNSTEGSSKCTQLQAMLACSGYNRVCGKTALTGWRLPTQNDFNRMIGADGCLSASNLRQLKGRQETSCASNAAGIWAMKEDEGYWSGTGTETSGVYYNLWANDCNSVAVGTDAKYVRPCFTFSPSAVYVDGTITLKNNGSDITAEARIDDTNQIIIVGNGQNACIPQYTKGTIIVPGKFPIGGTDYTVEVGQLAFRLCNSLTEVEIEEGVTTLGEFAFVGCSLLQKVTLPASLTSIGGGAFVNLPALTEVKCKSNSAPTWGYNDLFAYEGTADATSKLASQRTLYIPHKSSPVYKTSKYNDTVGWADAFGLIKEADAPTQVLEVSAFAQLQEISTNVNNGTTNYGDYTIRLTADLDGTSQSWTPIGTDENHAFSGVFDGQGHTIKNINANVNGANVGLFGYAQNANIGNFVLQNISMKGTDNVGPVAGTIVNTQVHDVMLYDESLSFYWAEATAGCAGGVVGKARNSTVNNCYFYGKVNGTTTGGIAGNGDGTGGITGVNDCAVAGRLEATGVIGGIIGTGANNAFAMRCYSRATLTGEAQKGGIVGIYTSNHDFNRIVYCTYLDFAESRIANEASGAFFDTMRSSSSYLKDMECMGMSGRLGSKKWYYFHDDLDDFPVPVTLAEKYLALANVKDSNGFLYAPIGTDEYSVIGYEGSAREITIPSSFNGKTVTTIADHAFDGSNITSAIIPDCITTIEENAFASCTELNTINIGAGATSTSNSRMTTRGNRAAEGTSVDANPDYNSWLDGCTRLANIILDDDNTAYVLDNGILYDEDMTTLIRCTTGYKGTLTVPSTVTEIAPGAFANCEELVWVDLRETTPAWHVDRCAEDSPFYESSKYTLFVMNKTSTAAPGEINVALYEKVKIDGYSEDVERHNCEQLLISDRRSFLSPLLFRADKVEYDRTFTSRLDLVKADPDDENSEAGYVYQPTGYTICLPFFTFVNANQGMKVYEFSGVTTEDDVTTVNFRESKIEDGKYNIVFSYPYYLVVESEGQFTLSYEGETFINEVSAEVENGFTDATTGVGYLFKGTTKGLSNEELYGDGSKPAYILQSDGNWHKVPENQPEAYVPPFRAYFQAESASAAARKLITSFGDSDDTTGIGQAVVRTTDRDGTQHYFDMSGRRLSGKPTQKGVYIYNGKTYINK